MTHKRVMLDLCCGEGLAAWGYWSSGMFSEILGVDIADMSSSYSFDFLKADIRSLDYEFLAQFDFIHASPPCQGYSHATPPSVRENHMRLIPGTKLMLHAANRPYVIENVPGAKRELRPNVAMNGLYFGLTSSRPRYFDVSEWHGENIEFMTKGRGKRIHGGDYVSRQEVIEAFGLGEVISRHALNKLTLDGMKQGIPPIFTKTIAQMIFPDKVRVG